MADKARPGTGKKKRKQKKLAKKVYEQELGRLQEELVMMQRWVRQTGARIVVIFEGRDTAGKGGVIRRITERVSARIFRVVALPKPSDRERTQLYLQRYIAHLPAGGEVVLFDRSWYNRLGVEKVMGFCTDAEYRDFLKTCPEFEHALVESGIVLIKYWLTVSDKQQAKRFQSRREDPSKQWKLSPMDVEARRRWYAYGRARDAMLEATDTQWAPWFIVDSNDQKRARLTCIRHLLSQIPYEALPFESVPMPERDESDAYDDEAALKPRRWVPDPYDE
jgi:polyphosphate kinase 2